MGVKTDAQLPRSKQFTSIMRSGILLPPPVSASVLEPLKKMGRAPGLQRSTKHNAQDVTTPIFCNGSNTPVRAAEGATAHNGGKPFTAGKSRIGFHSHRECMEGAHEYANEVGTRGKNPRKYQKSQAF